MGEKRPYRPPAGPGSEMQPREKKEYVPPVGPGSKSLPPTGSFSDPENAAVRGLMHAPKRQK